MAPLRGGRRDISSPLHNGQRLHRGRVLPETKSPVDVTLTERYSP